MFCFLRKWRKCPLLFEFRVVQGMVCMVIQLAQRGELYMNRLAMPAQRGHSVSLFFFFFWIEWSKQQDVGFDFLLTIFWFFICNELCLMITLLILFYFFLKKIFSHEIYVKYLQVLNCHLLCWYMLIFTKHGSV
jgi:hypothetical protein